MQVHAKPGCPLRGRIGACPTRYDPEGRPNAARSATGRAGWGTSAGDWVAQTPPLQCLQKHFRMAPAHIGIGLAFFRLVAEITPAIDHLFRRTTADAKLQTALGDQVRSASILDHIERIFIAHVDDGGADLDPACLCPDGCKQRKRRSELARKMVHAKIGAIRPSSSAATARSIDCRSVSPAERVPDWGAGDQWPKDRKPIFFMKLFPGFGRKIGLRPIWRP